eukprot:TRINITY_DN259_c3_g1_i1.p1 TRINITY_DN259_c3_g1~~TRINITY_DN259_c3_g1_i1.p1  ORF type:complete len:232 (+),score=49.11 TRINITY_DN259_c3_g1_i1:1481-2176(+)
MRTASLGMPSRRQASFTSHQRFHSPAMAVAEGFRDLKQTWRALFHKERDPRAATLREQLREEATLDFSDEIERCRAALSEGTMNDREECDTLLALAGMLVRSGRRAGVEEALPLLEDLALRELPRATDGTVRALGLNPVHGSEGKSECSDVLLAQCYYYIALAKYHLRALDESAACCSKILKISPQHQQTLTLRELVAEEHDSEDALQLAVGSGVLLSAVGAGLLLAGKKK